ncbi:peroxiredoxin [Actinomadura sp. NBRC 104412]|uniref:peroxiredoxin n=1 Tax=Actinomadura sp. NBRC 104412 TaxID=3032203 RepID=UPI0024A017CE|nr:peroxiredoxin [Actinomadura sp. NBRC 104412]GLZ05865.1 peroxiredoxin [Actinomadura sp. NBRC 104412]
MAVEVGDVAPDFELKDQHGTPVKLADFRGAKNVVLVFYPLAFSGVCTGELCAIRDELPTLGAATKAGSADDVQVLAVSVDSVFTLRAWSDQEKYQFPLLSDFWPHGGTAQRYGVFDEERGVALRGTFIIDTEGTVRWKVVNAVPDARDLDEYRKALAEL